MYKNPLLFCVILFVVFSHQAKGQTDSSYNSIIYKTDSLPGVNDSIDYLKQLDLIDIGIKIIKRDPRERIKTNIQQQSVKFHIAAAPSVGYSSATGFVALATANVGFYLGNQKDQKISSVQTYLALTTEHQILFPTQLSIFTKNNRYKLVGDWRYLKYPQDTYGLGGHTSLADGYIVNYNMLRFHQFILKSVLPHTYAGIGIQYDKHWNISQEKTATTIIDFDRYGFSTTSISSAISANVLFDNRINQINPAGGTYLNAIFRQNAHFLGSDENWNSLIIDARQYFPVGHNKNVLALWSYNWLVLNGKAPYTDLPATGWDTYNNTGRGYIQNRFKGNGLLDLEAEFRFGILHNGLIGAVVFADAESVEDYPGNKFTTIAPAAGAGLRIQFNKFSRTNIALDYGIGLNGSRGFFVNLGEVF